MYFDSKLLSLFILLVCLQYEPLQIEDFSIKKKKMRVSRLVGKPPRMGANLTCKRGINVNSKYSGSDKAKFRFARKKILKICHKQIRRGVLLIEKGNYS